MISRSQINNRFRGFLPVVIDVETGGFNPQTDALLEIGYVVLGIDSNNRIVQQQSGCYHVAPFEGANLEPSALAFTGIDPDHPFRNAIREQEALAQLFDIIRDEIELQACSRAILVGHNPSFDLAFMNAAISRCHLQKTPFHMFSTFDTATLGGLAYGQTVLARAAKEANIEWDNNQAHSALYDAEKTAELFCNIINRWEDYTEQERSKNNGQNEL